MRDLTDEVEAAGFRAVGITDLMNSEEMESALTDIVQKQLTSPGGNMDFLRFIVFDILGVTPL